MYTFGDWPGADIEKTDLVIYWAVRPCVLSPFHGSAQNAYRSQKTGGKGNCIKPSVEPDAGMADIWVPVRPGTDAALALAMLNVVVNEDLIDSAFVEKWCYGYDRLREHVQKYPRNGLKSSQASGITDT
jgi:anaerobic selenocysteine-containing dehydrogenase